MSAASETDRHNIFARTDEEWQRAFEHLSALGSSGASRDLIEVAVCADCGWWGKLDSDLWHEPGRRPTGIVCSHPSGRHLITRVHMKPISPADAS